MKNDVLSTRQVAQLLGVGEATVKRWADAGEIECFRTPGGHRKFRLRDVTAFVQKRDFETSGPMPAGVPPGLEEDPAAAAELLQKTALRGDAGGCVALISSLRLRGHSLAAIFDDVMALTLRAVGDQWEHGRASVAEEHIVSQTLIDAVARAQPLAEPPGEPVRPHRGVAVVAAALGEQHDIPLRMAACLLRASGFEVLAPLAQTPARALADLVVRSRAALVVLSSTTPGNAREVEEQIALAVEATRHTNGRVVVGGPGMRALTLPREVRMLSSMQELLADSDTAGRKRPNAARTVV